MKTIRKAVRTFLIDKEKVVAIKYILGNNRGYYDVPGGKIEKDETSIEAAIREFKEETKMDIYNPKYAGNLIVEYPNRVYDIDIYIAKEYSGKPLKTADNLSLWINIDELLRKDKLFSTIYLLDENHYRELTNLADFKWHFISNINHKKVDEIFYSND